MKLVNQPTSNTCTSACLAMITGMDVNIVISEFHDDWRLSKNDPKRYLETKGVKCEFNDGGAFNNCLSWDSVFLLTVPSLNLDGKLHHIVVDLRGHGDVDVTVLDPNNGKDGKRYYIPWNCEPKNNMEVALSSWVLDLEVVPND